mmetsp:Transcript_71533/g.222032  ORF Transcript_71533/g.222032 Transcript_71533/m.222032 type:complete len:243 (+) Transcript_71533:2436-3164(+)
MVHGFFLAVPSGHVVAVARAPLCIGVELHALVVGPLPRRALALVPRERQPEGLRKRLLLVGGQKLARPVKHPLRGHGQTHEARQHVREGRVRAERGVHGKPHGEAEPQVGARKVHHEETHEPAGRWRRVETQAAGAEERREDRGSHGGDAVVDVHARAGEAGEVCDVLAIHVCLSNGQVAPCRVAGEVELLVHHVVAPVVTEQPHANGASRPSDGMPQADVHGSTREVAEGPGVSWPAPVRA